MASASSVLMLVVVVELCSDTEFPLGESERVDVFPIVAKGSLALAATSHRLFCILHGQRQRCASDFRRHRPVDLHLDELRSQFQRFGVTGLGGCISRSQSRPGSQECWIVW